MVIMRHHKEDTFLEKHQWTILGFAMMFILVLCITFERLGRQSTIQFGGGLTTESTMSLLVTPIISTTVADFLY